MTANTTNKTYTNKDLKKAVATLPDEGYYSGRQKGLENYKKIDTIIQSWVKELGISHGGVSFTRTLNESPTPKTQVLVRASYSGEFKRKTLKHLTKEWIETTHKELVKEREQQTARQRRRDDLARSERGFHERLSLELTNFKYSSSAELALIKRKINFTLDLDQEKAIEVAKVEYGKLLKISETLKNL